MIILCLSIISIIVASAKLQSSTFEDFDLSPTLELIQAKAQESQARLESSFYAKVEHTLAIRKWNARAKAKAERLLREYNQAHKNFSYWANLALAN